MDGDKHIYSSAFTNIPRYCFCVDPFHLFLLLSIIQALLRIVGTTCLPLFCMAYSRLGFETINIVIMNAIPTLNGKV